MVGPVEWEVSRHEWLVESQERGEEIAARLKVMEGSESIAEKIARLRGGGPAARVAMTDDLKREQTELIEMMAFAKKQAALYDRVMELHGTKVCRLTFHAKDRSGAKALTDRIFFVRSVAEKFEVFAGTDEEAERLRHLFPD
jgi:hypothetical protein